MNTEVADPSKCCLSGHPNWTIYLCSFQQPPTRQSPWRGGEQREKIVLLIPAPLVIKGSTSTSLIGSLLPFFFFFAHRHPTTAYPEERSRGGESEDTPAHTVRGVHGKDAADNMRPDFPSWLFTSWKPCGSINSYPKMKRMPVVSS
ncbi:unnamed protein product [Menidia menidia]|uniref:(Atlantic silverside) hypothetical protein n=1 Tax=Menidia menidia TaxID=238744 RepID=A0A8S4BLB5_9TELE|nr:unnamed protein product [Menidia menidia]